MTDATPLDENELAFAAISLLGNKVHGEKPDWLEIEAWQQKTLSVERAAEVLSHIANDAECFQQWLDVCEASDWLTQESIQQKATQASQAATTVTTLRDTLKAWITSLFGQSMPVYAAGFAVLFLAVLVVPILQNSNDIQQRLDDGYERYMAMPRSNNVTAPLPRKTRSMGNLFNNPTAAEIEQHYFSQGLTQGLAKLQLSSSPGWINWLDTLPADELDCAKAADPNACQSVAEDFKAVGQWAIMIYSACQSDLPENTQFWQQQLELYSDLKQLPAMQNSSLLQPLMDANPATSKETLCVSVGQLLNTLQ